jgi:uncharacterized protein with FMN-binding domain
MRCSLLLIAALLCAACHGPREAPALMYELVPLEDGVYSGKHKGAVGMAVVEVTIEDGRIEDVRIVRGFSSPIGRKAYRRLPERIVERRTVEVDAVTGATYSSNIIKTAVRDALGKAAQGKEDHQGPD